MSNSSGYAVVDELGDEQTTGQYAEASETVPLTGAEVSLKLSLRAFMVF